MIPFAILTEDEVEAGSGQVMAVVPSGPTAEPLTLNEKVVSAVRVTLAPMVLLTSYSTEMSRVGLGELVKVTDEAIGLAVMTLDVAGAVVPVPLVVFAHAA